MTATEPDIRRAASSDFGDMARLHYTSHTVSFAPFASTEWVSSRQLSDYLSKWEDTLSSVADDDATFVAWYDGAIIGMVRVSPLESPTYDAQLSSMHVSPELIGKGVGTLLMQAALKFIAERGFARAQLGVIAANTRARTFYEAHGWILAEEHPNGIEGVPTTVYKLEP